MSGYAAVSLEPEPDGAQPGGGEGIVPGHQLKPSGNRSPALVVAPGPCGALSDNQPPVRDDVRLTSALAINFHPGQQRRGQIVLTTRSGHPSPDDAGHPARKPELDATANDVGLRDRLVPAAESKQCLASVVPIHRAASEVEPQGFVLGDRCLGYLETFLVTAGAQQ